jgi:hypothetical protein
MGLDCECSSDFDKLKDVAGDCKRSYGFHGFIVTDIRDSLFWTELEWRLVDISRYWTRESCWANDPIFECGYGSNIAFNTASVVTVTLAIGFNLIQEEKNHSSASSGACSRHIVLFHKISRVE